MRYTCTPTNNRHNADWCVSQPRTTTYYRANANSNSNANTNSKANANASANANANNNANVNANANANGNGNGNANADANANANANANFVSHSRAQHDAQETNGRGDRNGHETVVFLHIKHFVKV